MPRFSANLGFLWPDRPLLERIEAAADAGYRAIELHYPYDVPAAELKAAYQKRGLELLGLNTQIGAGPDGHRGYAAVPGREADFHALAEQAIAYASEAGGTAVHMMAGNVAPERHAEGFATIVANLKWPAPKAAAAETPRVKGLASGLFSTVCISAPDSARAAPTSTAVRA